MKKTKTELGEIKLQQPANVINSPEDCVKVLGKDFSGTSWQLVESIAKNIVSRDFKEAVRIYNELRDLELIEKDGIIWKFKKIENE